VFLPPSLLISIAGAKGWRCLEDGVRENNKDREEIRVLLKILKAHSAKASTSFGPTEAANKAVKLTDGKFNNKKTLQQHTWGVWKGETRVVYSLCGIQENLSESQVSSLDSKQNGLFTFTSPRSLGSWKHRGQIARTCMQPPTQGQLSPFHEGLANCNPVPLASCFALFLEVFATLRKKTTYTSRQRASKCKQEADE